MSPILPYPFCCSQENLYVKTPSPALPEFFHCSCVPLCSLVSIIINMLIIVCLTAKFAHNWQCVKFRNWTLPFHVRTNWPPEGNRLQSVFCSSSFAKKRLHFHCNRMHMVRWILQIFRGSWWRWAERKFLSDQIEPPHHRKSGSQSSRLVFFA